VKDELEIKPPTAALLPLRTLITVLQKVVGGDRTFVGQAHQRTHIEVEDHADIVGASVENFRRNCRN